MKHASLFFVILCTLLCLPLFAQTDPAEFAMKVSLDKAAYAPGETGTLTVVLTVPDNMHITSQFLAIEFATPGLTLGESSFSPASQAEGETIYKGLVSFARPFTVTDAFSGTTIAGHIGYQVCEDFPNPGCLPPIKRDFSAPIKLTIAPAASEPAAEQSAAAAEEPDAKQSAPQTADTRALDSRIARALEGNLALALLLVFVAGMLTSLTPCVYPMIPITIAVFSKQGSRWQSFVKSLFYVLGLALTYSLLGLLSGLTGTLFGAFAGNPFFIAIISLILLAMALSMFGLFDIQLPAAMQSRLSSGQKGGFIGIFLLGVAFGFIAAPCAGPIVITILTWIAKIQNPLLGFVVLFVYALGLGLLFIILGTFSGALSSLPHAGKWMDEIKKIFGYMILLVIIYFMAPLLPGGLTNGAYGFILLMLGLFLLLEFAKSLQNEGIRIFFMALGILLLLLALSLLLPALSIGLPTTGHNQVEQTGALQWLEDLDQARQAAKLAAKPLFVDFTADWCAYCKKMERTTFTHPDVSARLQDYVLAKVDLTEIHAANKELMKQHGIKGLPMIIIYDATGAEQQRIDRYLDAQALLSRLGD